MTVMQRIYVDNAATSFPKPESVYAAVDHFQRELGTAVGRGATRSSLTVQGVVDRCRARAARLLGARRAEQVLFTFNGTDSLNLALHGLLHPGDRVIASPWEHNSVLRPLKALAASGVTTTYLSPTAAGTFDLNELQQALQQPTRLVVLTHASNVTGAIQPVAEAIDLAHQSGALVLIDAAQSAGHIPVHMGELQADLIACPGHKGLLGPLGTGLLLVREGLERELAPIRQGGTGTVSETEDQPNQLPSRYESGNHNAPGLFGLETSLAWLESQSLATLREHELELTAALLSGLQEIPGIIVHGPQEATARVGVISISLPQLPPQTFSTLLDEHFGIECRAGLHCAPRAHAALGTLAAGGTVRFSPGPFTTLEEIESILDAVAQIAASV